MLSAVTSEPRTILNSFSIAGWPSRALWSVQAMEAVWLPTQVGRVRKGPLGWWWMERMVSLRCCSLWDFLYGPCIVSKLYVGRIRHRPCAFLFCIERARIVPQNIWKFNHSWSWNLWVLYLPVKLSSWPVFSLGYQDKEIGMFWDWALSHTDYLRAYSL